MTRTRVSGTRLWPLRVGLKVRWRERGAGLRAAVDNGGRKAAAERGGGIADGELGGRSTRSWIKSNPGLSSAARRSRPPQPPRRAAMAESGGREARAGCGSPPGCFGQPGTSRERRAHVLGNVDVLANPQGGAPHQRPRLGLPEKSPERLVVALAEHLRVQPAAAGRGAGAVRLAARGKEGLCLGVFARSTRFVPHRSMSMPEAAGAHHMTRRWNRASHSAAIATLARGHAPSLYVARAQARKPAGSGGPGKNP